MAQGFNIIIGPLFTEKSTQLQGMHNQYVFEVHPRANRIEIKKEVEKVFPKVKVEDVKTIHVRGKVRRIGQSMGKRSNWKKAIVTLREGDQLEFYEGV